MFAEQFSQARADMTSRDWRIFREDHKMSTRGGRVPHPARSWSETGLPAELVSKAHQKETEKKETASTETCHNLAETFFPLCLFCLWRVFALC